jgi:hypothetical protein
MVLAGIKVVDTPLVRDAIELARNSSEPYFFNHAMRSWSFGVLIAKGTKPAPDPELLAVSAVLHDLGLTDRYSAHQIQLVWDAIALHRTPLRFIPLVPLLCTKSQRSR